MTYLRGALEPNLQPAGSFISPTRMCTFCAGRLHRMPYAVQGCCGKLFKRLLPFRPPYSNLMIVDDFPSFVATASVSLAQDLKTTQRVSRNKNYSHFQVHSIERNSDCEQDVAPDGNHWSRVAM